MADQPVQSLLDAFSGQDKKNAEYLEEAMGIHPPHPTKKFEFSPNAVLQEYIDALRVSHPQYFDVDTFCAEPLGKY